MGELRNPNETQGNLAELARECRPPDAQRLHAHGRDREPGREGARLCRHRRHVAVAVRHDAGRILGDVRPAVGGNEAALRPAALLHADQAQPEVRQCRAARDRPDPRRSARQHVGAGVGQYLRRRRAEGLGRHRLRPRGPAEGQEVHAGENGEGRRGLLHLARFRAASGELLDRARRSRARGTAKSSATPRPGTSTTRTTCASRCAPRSMPTTS